MVEQQSVSSEALQDLLPQVQTEGITIEQKQKIQIFAEGLVDYGAAKAPQQKTIRQLSRCHGKPSCSVNRGYNIPNPCNLFKWTEFWYDCVPVQDLLVTSPSTQIPNYPILGGFDEYGRDLFVGRAFKDNDLLPCYVTPGSYCVFSNNDVTDGNNTFDYLVGGVVYANGPKYSWLRNHRGEVPPAAVTLGQTKDGDPLFVGRAEFGSGLYIGKVVPNQALFAVYIANSYPNYTYTDYKLGWKHATACEYFTMNINCTGGTVIEMKTAWYGKAVPHIKGCNGSSQRMPSGGCPTNEYNIRFFREA
ncbi:hypothetical protein GE061_018479 [Apolygus lucorum]|uniref:Uncharacterized protein n=1 Tax=Apolygus lucorum TaxID=248454 RepID=A0A8S9XG30_APOLU|nr:hypothetical protein GE061_018479 [Apolygus lucorum]